MWNNGHDAYLESRVMTADPVELIDLLYQACTQSVRNARAHLAEGRILERAREITKACAIVTELAVVLDHERGGEISQRLALLYDYIQRRLITANLEQSDVPLAEVVGLLETLSEGWAGVRTPEVAAPAPEVPAESSWSESSWAPPAPVESPWSQPVAAESAWSQPAPVDNPWAQPAPAENPWAEPVPAESAWAQPVAQESTYGMQSWSLQG